MSGDATLDPRRNLELAQELARDTVDQARLRAAISRGYYGLFLIAREKTGITDQRDVHRRVIAVIDREYPSLATKLGYLRYLREVSDYQLLPRNARHRDWVMNWREFSDTATEALAILEELPERI